MALTANAVLKSRFIARYGPGQAGFGVKSGDLAAPGHNNRFWSDVDGVKRPLGFDDVIALTANRTVLEVESGTTFHFNSATSLIATLPAVSRGLRYRFFSQLAAGSGIGHSIGFPGATVKMIGKVSSGGAATAGTNAKGRTNTQATGTVGDCIEVWSDGVNWFAAPVAGIFAESA